jgi:hypothetical protein
LLDYNALALDNALNQAEDLLSQCELTNSTLMAKLLIDWSSPDTVDSPPMPLSG